MGLNASMMHVMPGEQLDASYEPVILQFGKLLNDPNVAVRSIALDNLNRCKRLTVDTIAQALHDDSSEVREVALRALLEIGIEKTKAILLAEVIEDPVAEISDAVIESITHPWYKDKIDPQTLADAIIDLLVIRKTDLPPQNFSPEQVVQALQQTVKLSPPLRESILVKLCDLAYSHEDSIRTRSIRVARRLGQDDFSALVQERSNKDPSAARAILNLLGNYSDADAIVRQFSEVAPDDVKSIAALQTGLLQEYYENALEQTKTSFRWAIISTMIGFGCLVATVVYLLITTVSTDTGTPDLVGILTGVSSVLSQFIGGVQFLLYDRAGKRLAQSQLQLHQVQRFQLANSVCESLEGKAQHKARADLVKSIANLQTDSVDLPITNNAG